MHRRDADQEAAAGDRDHQPAAVEQQHQAGAAGHRAELPGRVEEADVAVGRGASTCEREADDDHLGEALEEEQRRGRRPGQSQRRVGGEGAQADAISRAAPASSLGLVE